MSYMRMMPHDEDTGSLNYDDEGSTEEEEEIGLLTQLNDDTTLVGKLFLLVTGIVICLSTLSMAVEVDLYPDHPNWVLWNSAVLVYFCLEIFIRVGGQGCCTFFSCTNPDVGWNYFDIGIVLMCMLDQWLLPLMRFFQIGCEGTECVNDATHSRFGNLRIFRTFRILRMLRVLTLTKACSQLTNIVAGLVDALGTVFWIATLMLMFMLIFAITLTDVAGNQAKEAQSEEDLFFEYKDDIIENWGSVGRSMISWFQILTFDDWVALAEPVYNEIPVLWFLFFIYIFIMGMAMISLLTGVVAERMSEVSTATKASLNVKDDEELRDFLDKEMQTVEASVRKKKATDASTPVGEQGMSMDEFQIFMEQPEVKEKLKDLGTMLEDHEVGDFFECVDRDGSGEVSHDELKAGILRLRGEMRPTDLLRIRYAAQRIARRLQGGDGEASTSRKVEEINVDLHDCETKLDKMQKSLEDFVRKQLALRQNTVSNMASRKLQRGICA